MYTDHKPLVGILNKPLDQVVSPRLQRLLIKLLRYRICLKYVPNGKEMYVADIISRLQVMKDKKKDIEKDMLNAELVHVRT